MKIVGNVKKITILQAKALGDFIVLLPALKAIKSSYPHAELILLAKPWHKQFLAHQRSPVDRVIVIPPLDGVRDEPEKKGQNNASRTKENPKEIARFFEGIKDEKFDIAVHFQGDGKKANPFINSLGARLTIGMRNSGVEKIDRSIPYVHYQSEVLRNLEIVSLIGAKTKDIEPEIKILSQDLNEAKSILGSLEKYVVIHAGADDIRRLWPVEKFAKLGNHLSSKGYSVVLTGTQKEKQLVDEVNTLMKNKAIDVCGRLSLSGLVGVLLNASLYISADTGPLHLARALHTPTVGLYWLPNLLNWGPLTRTIHRPVIEMELRCPLCNIIPADPWPFEPITQVCDHPISFIQAIPVDRVIEQVNDLLHIK